VRDTQQLQKKLDSMVFGGLKMNVNVPKYGRAKNESHQQQKGSEQRPEIHKRGKETRT